ncbi:MAG: GMC family oxidoreductase [Acidobacteria bacterium]|nr:GMC family oxidoreductase [Acidobacteriota bacterium]
MLQEKLYDVIVVGAGFAGAIVATKIAQQGVDPSNGERLKIALIEGGAYFKGKPNWGYGIPSRRQMFTHIGQDMSQGDRWGRIVDGRRYPGVGGASLHWGGKGHPPEDKDYEWWVQETGVDWTKENMKGAVQETLRMFHSHTVPDKILNEYHFRFRDVAHAMGYQTQKMLIHKKNCIMCGTHVESMPACRYDAKVSTLLSHIPIAEENDVEILADTNVERVILEKRGAEWVATGVWYREKGAPAQKAEAKKIILACGGELLLGHIGTPQLLYDSGYGPRDLLGDKMIVENPNVGSHLEGHPGSMLQPVSARFEDLIVHEIGDGNFGFWFLDDKDSKGSERLFILSGADTTDLALFRGAESYALSKWAPEFGHKHKDWMRKNWQEWRHIADTPFYLGPLVAYCHSAAPKARYLPDRTLQFDGEHPIIKKRTKELRDLLRTLFEKMGAKEIRDSPGIAFPFIHGVGACRAGADRKNSVVNPNFECHEVPNLFIVDSTTHPRVTSLWSGAMVTASVATFAAERILTNHFKRSQI